MHCNRRINLDISFILDYVDDNVLASQALVYLQRGWEQSRWLRRSSIKMALVRLVNNNNNNDYAIEHWGLVEFIYVGLKRFPSQNWVEKYFATTKVTQLLPRKKCVCDKVEQKGPAAFVSFTPWKKTIPFFFKRA